MPIHSRQRWLMLFIAFLAQNLAVGLTFASVGLLMEPLTRDLEGSRGLLSLSIAFVIVANGLLGPVVGMLVDRWSLRGTMMLGALLGAAGFFLAAQADSTTAYLIYYGLLVGVGFAMMGVLPANKIITLWFPHTIGKVSGIVNVPLFNMLGPPLYAVVIASLGWRSLLELFAVAYLGLMLLCALIRVPSSPAKPAALGGNSETTASVMAEQSPFKKPLFWMLALIYGLLMSSGIAAITHAAPNALNHGIAITQASLLLSILGICGIAGNFLFGWLCDRLTPFAAMLINASVQTVGWLVLANAQGFVPMAVAVAGIGLGSAGVMPIFVAVITRVYGVGQFGRIYGMIGLVALPLAFGAAPFAGLLYDLFGGYWLAFLLQGGVCALALIIIGMVSRAAAKPTSEPLPSA